MMRQLMTGLCMGMVVGLTALNQTPSAGQTEKAKRPKMDLAFCIDTTGSMQSEINMVKTKTKEIVAKLSGGKPAPQIRVAVVAYRDRGDEYVTRVYQFTDNIDQIVKDITGLQASGGGDGPESVNEGLHVAVNDLHWDQDKEAVKMLFLIGDAPPHFYAHDYDWKDESKKAIAQGIQINTIACQGLHSYPDGQSVFEQIAKLSDGKFENLAYRQEIAGEGGRKETIVTAGGAAYKMKADGTDEWKASVANGMVEKVDMPAPVAAAAPSAFRGAAYGGTAIHAYSRIAADKRESSAYLEGSRQDNNLDDIVLNAAKARAAKMLNVDYGR